MDNVAPTEDTPTPTAGASLLADYLTRVDAAAAIGMSAKSLDRLHHAGDGPARTVIAGRIYYRVEALRAWLLTQEDAA